MFLVPMDSSGIEITPVHTLGGERTNITFYTDVRVPGLVPRRRRRRRLVGDARGAGVRAQQHQLGRARPARPRRSRHGPRRRARWTIPRGRRSPRLHATAMEVGRLLVYRAATMAAAGAMTPVEGSMAQLFLPEAFTRAAVRPARHPRRARCPPARRGRGAARRSGRARLPALDGHHDLRRVERGAARHHRRAGPRASPAPADRRPLSTGARALSS